uniref:Sodium channel neurotoxin MeuNaTxalpha-4 n=1 Tax=Mesobuthus eupeus TaxID=34648 RepID=SCXN4_MESEU|nr:RecName: Full=Sodium channel neurotoxin MeuNaTxalpha-4; Flags: Precursor [Mesobuthus eupeus]ABR21068.1 venom sodium channel toxin-6 [Mesobuthus eupeus]
MNYLILISFALLVITGVESARDAYIAKPHNCVYECFDAFSSYCNGVCTKNGAKSGYCQILGTYGNGCWCIVLPDNVPIRIPGKCHR